MTCLRGGPRIVAPQRDSGLKSGEVDMGGISAQPVGIKKPKTKYIKLFAAINQQSINALMNVVDQELKGGIERFVLLISSPGGSDFYGLSAYNFLKGIPAEVITHNFGSVDSIAAVLFCTGNKRYSVPHARFLLHGVAASFEKAAFEEKQLEERLKSLQIDMQNIAGVIAATTRKTEKEIFDAMVERTTLNPEQAREFGLVHEIKEELIEPGADLISIVQN